MNLSTLLCVLLTGLPNKHTTIRTTLDVKPPGGVVLNIPADVVGTTLTDVARNATITCSRGTMDTATYVGVGGTVNTATRSQPRVESSGLLIEEARTNLLPYSASFISGSTTVGSWALYHASTPANPIVSTTSIVNPTGNVSNVPKAYFYGINDSTGVCIIYYTVSGSIGPWAISTYIEGATTSGTIYGNAGPILMTCNAAVGSWARCSASGTLSAGTNNATFGFDGRPLYGQPTVQSAYTASLWGVQVELGAYPTSCIVTTTTPVLRPADVVYVANPIPSGRDFFIGVTATPESGRAWTQTSSTYLMSVGDHGTASSAYLLITSTGNVSFNTKDASNNVWTGTWAHNFANGSTHRIVAGQIAGQPNLWIDGVSVSVSLSGSGVGVYTQPATIYLGVGNSTPDGPFGGNLKYIKACTQLAKCL
jgi:hypothetical protein